MTACISALCVAYVFICYVSSLQDVYMLQETQKEQPENVVLDVFLMNGHKITINIVSTDQTEEVLEVNQGQQIRSKIDSFQNSNFLISQPNSMM